MVGSSLGRYGVALLSVAVALPLVRWLTESGYGAGQVFLAAIMVSAWYGGLGPGLLATVLSTLTLQVLLPPTYSLETGTANVLRVGVFLLVALLISSLNAAKSRLERTLRQEHRRKDEFLAELAHELRAPLGTLLNAMHVLRLSPGSSSTVERSVDLIERQVRHMSRLINDLLDVCRIRQGKLALHRERVDLAAVVGDAVEATHFSREEKGQRMEVSLPAEKVLVEADPTQLEQVVVNLLTNAAKFTDEGGHIRIAAERAGDDVLLHFQDDGHDIPPELLPRIFDLHVQAENGSHGGLGIGLSLVRGLVEMHGGTVTAVSKGCGQGSEFVVRLPAPSPSPGATALHRALPMPNAANTL
jgi:signal transduction histidine kinase